MRIESLPELAPLAHERPVLGGLAQPLSRSGFQGLYESVKEDEEEPFSRNSEHNSRPHVRASKEAL